MLEEKLADADVSKEEQKKILKLLEKKETEYMRLRRRKIGLDDFQLLTIIGRGAFGEVIFLHGMPLLFSFLIYFFSVFYLQVRLCREKTTGHVYAMKKQKKSETISKNQVIVRTCVECVCYTSFFQQISWWRYL